MSDFPNTVGVSFIAVRDDAGNVIRESSGNPIAAALVTKDLDFDMRQSQKQVNAILAEITAATSPHLVRVEIGHRNSLDDDIEWEMFPLGASDSFHHVRITDRYIKLRIASDSVGVMWRLGALEIYGRGFGRRI